MLIEIPYGRQIRFPRRCVQCLAPATVVRSLVIHSESVLVGNEWRSFSTTLNIPYCEQHAQQAAAVEKVESKNLSTSFVIALVVGFVGAFLVGRSTDWDLVSLGLVFAAIFLVGLGVTSVVIGLITRWRNPEYRKLKASDQGGAGVTGRLKGDTDKPEREGDITKIELEFENPEFAQLFARINLLAMAQFVRQRQQRSENAWVSLEDLCSEFVQSLTEEEKGMVGASLDSDVQPAMEDALFKMRAKGEAEYLFGRKLWRLQDSGKKTDS